MRTLRDNGSSAGSGSDSNTEPMNWRKVMLSAIASFVGIQSSTNHDRDDAHIEKVGFLPYIIAGVTLTVVFVLVLVGAVDLIIRTGA